MKRTAPILRQQMSEKPKVVQRAKNHKSNPFLEFQMKSNGGNQIQDKIVFSPGVQVKPNEYLN